MHKMEESMKHIVTIALAAALAGAGVVSAQAGNAKFGASAYSPGYKMQANGSVSGHPGASGYAPGQQMRTNGSVRGTTGASGYAPGHLKSDTNANARIKAGRSTVGTGVHVHTR
jgi:hypothetical protein